MIPKIIHYCWFGKGEKSELVQKCIESWQKFCPDYQILEWNEDNFDVNQNEYVKEAYESKKWAFVSDYVRLYALEKCGGVYVDTDVEIIKSIDQYLKYKGFTGCGYDGKVPSALMGCEMHHPLIYEFLHDYDDIHFIKPDGSFDLTTNVERMTADCINHGLVTDGSKQTVCEYTFFPVNYFSPKNHETGDILLTKNTVCIHHYDGSWIDDETKYFIKKYTALKNYLPIKFCGLYCKFISTLKYRGFKVALSLFKGWIKK